MPNGQLTELREATEIFVAAISQVRSYFYPHPWERHGEIYVLRDKPDRKNPRKIELVTIDEDPSRVVSEIRGLNLGWHFLCHIHPEPSELAEIKSEFKSLGYRALSTEWMFIHDLKDIPVFTSQPPVRPVETQAEADQIPQLAQHKLKVRRGARDFWIWDENRDYGQVRSVDVGSSAWVQGLHVRADARRRGFGKALMSSLLQSNREQGKEKSVLLASTAGATVYPQLGYREIATLQMFCPADRKTASRN